MIRVDIDRSAGRIVGFRIKGHALFAEKGKDIVCAGASAVAVGTVNAAEAVVGVTLTVKMESGLIDAMVPESVPEASQTSLQVLLESMVVMLQTIERSYGEHIRVKEHFR